MGKIFPMGVMALITLVLTLAYFKLWEGYDASWGMVMAPLWGGAAYLVGILLLIGCLFISVIVFENIMGK